MDRGRGDSPANNAAPAGLLGGQQRFKPKKGEGIFQYALHFEADAVAEGTPESDDKELFLDIKCMLTGVITAMILERCFRKSTRCNWCSCMKIC